MMQKTKQVRTHLFALILAGVTGVGFATAATAAGVGVGIKADVGAGATVVGSDNAQAGGVADVHMSPSGSANSNAQWKNGATQGEDRAAERMNPNGEVPEAELDASGTVAVDGAVKGKRSGTR